MSRPASQGLRVAAPAKLNLYLHVTGRRADGYHELDSLMTFVTLHDVIEIRPAARLTVSLGGPFARSIDERDNLVARAARSLGDAAERAPAVAIRLDKQIPVAAGLGGGSADAAAVLRGLSALWALDAGVLPLADLALRLGADVPVCLASRAMMVGGIGEKLRPVDGLPDAALVLVNPGVPVPTAPVFAAREGPFSAPAAFGPSTDVVGLADALARCTNDLEAPARTLAPAVGDALEALRRTDGCLLARMSGSGATCFGLYATDRAAEAAAHAIAVQQADWWVQPCNFAHNGLPAAAPAPMP